MNGVMTEERFQKMTDIQWFIHYKMIEREEREEWNAKKELIQTLLEVGFKRFEDLFEKSSELVAMIVNPPVFEEYLKVKDSGGSSKQETLEQMESKFKDLLASGEIELSIELDIKGDDDSIALEKAPRKKLGIQRNEVK